MHSLLGSQLPLTVWYDSHRSRKEGEGGHEGQQVSEIRASQEPRILFHFLNYS